MADIDKIRRDALHEVLSREIARRYPGARLERIARLGESRPDEADGTEKSLGYGVSFRIDLTTAEGAPRRLVFRTSRSDDFGTTAGRTAPHRPCSPTTLSTRFRSTCEPSIWAR